AKQEVALAGSGGLDQTLHERTAAQYAAGRETTRRSGRQHRRAVHVVGKVVDVVREIVDTAVGTVHVGSGVTGVVLLVGHLVDVVIAFGRCRTAPGFTTHR